LEKARQVVSAFMDYWRVHGTVLRVRNVAADEGNPAFLAIRSKATTPLLAAMTAQMEQGQARSGITPMAAAVALGAILDRLSAYQKELEGLGLRREDIVSTSAHILHQTLAG